MDSVYWVLKNVLAGRPGPALEPWDATALFDGGIRAIVSLDDSGVDETHLREAGIKHLALYQPMILLHEERFRRVFIDKISPAFPFIDDARERGEPVLVHCYYGCDRTGALLACYLVSRERLGAESAIAVVRDAQPNALLAAGYAEAVHLFEASNA